MLTYKWNAGGQQQDPDKQVLKLLHNQLPDALTCEKKAKEWRRVTDWGLNTDARAEMCQMIHIQLQNQSAWSDV